MLLQGKDSDIPRPHEFELLFRQVIRFPLSSCSDKLFASQESKKRQHTQTLNNIWTMDWEGWHSFIIARKHPSWMVTGVGFMHWEIYSHKRLKRWFSLFWCLGGGVVCLGDGLSSPGIPLSCVYKLPCSASLNSFGVQPWCRRFPNTRLTFSLRCVILYIIYMSSFFIFLNYADLHNSTVWLVHNHKL